jgi:uncharacterized membrane protein
VDYSILKVIHILSAIFLFGAGFGSAFHKFLADRSKELRAQVAANRQIVVTDWVFTVPTVVIQPATGWAMATLGGYSIANRWLAVAIGLYGFAGLCWIPAVFLEIKMRDLSLRALVDNTPLPSTYYHLARIWCWLGVPAFLAMVVIVYLMVVKPN